MCARPTNLSGRVDKTGSNKQAPTEAGKHRLDEEGRAWKNFGYEVHPPPCGYEDAKRTIDPLHAVHCCLA